MAQAWWDEGAHRTADFPTLVTDLGELVALGTPDVGDEVMSALGDNAKLADIIVFYMHQPFTPNVCFQAAQYLTSIYSKVQPQSYLQQSYDIVCSKLTLPPSIPGTY